MDQKYLVAIQIGSTCVKGAVATISSAADSSLSVVNVVEEPIHDSVIYGIVQNVRDVEGAVTNVINRIEERLKNRRVAHVYVGVDGRTFRAQPKTIEQNYFEEPDLSKRFATASLTAKTLRIKSSTFSQNRLSLTTSRPPILSAHSAAMSRPT